MRVNDALSIEEERQVGNERLNFGPFMLFIISWPYPAWKLPFFMFFLILLEVLLFWTLFLLYELFIVLVFFLHFSPLSVPQSDFSLLF